MLTLILSFFLIISIIKAEKISISNFKIETNKLYTLSKFTFNNYSRSGPVNQGLNYRLKESFPQSIKDKKAETKAENELLFKFFFILSDSSLSIKNKEVFCQDGINNKESFSDENVKKITYIKEYSLLVNSKPNNQTNNNLNNSLENEINDTFKFNKTGVKTVYFYNCYLIKEEGDEYKKIESTNILNGEVNLFNTGTMESAENFYRTYLYLLITCYYGFLTCYWIFKILGNLGKINLLMNIFSGVIPFVLLENVMRWEFYSSLSRSGTYNYPFKYMEIIFRCFKEIGIRTIYFFIANGYQTLNKFPNKYEIKYFSVILFIYLVSFIFYENSLIQYESDFINHPLSALFFSTIIIIAINVYMWFFYIYRKIKIYELNFKDKNFRKNAEILRQYSFSLFAYFIAFLVYIGIFVITLILYDSFNKVYFKWVGDLADRSMSMFVFTTICLNLWEEKELINYTYDKELNISGGEKESNVPKSKNVNTASENNKEEPNVSNLPGNEELKAEKSTKV